MSLQDNKQFPCRSTAFTLVELLVITGVTGMVGMALLPSLNTAKETVNAAVCLGNMHQWGMAISMYCEEWNDYIPAEGIGAPMSAGRYAWYNILSPYINAPSLIDLYAAGKPPLPSTKSIYSCPSVTNFPSSVSDANPFYMYGMNGHVDPNGPPLFKRAESVMPSNTFLFCENEGSFSTERGKYCPARHSGGANFTFIDGHAEWIEFQDFCRERLGCTNSFLDINSSKSGDWKVGIKYHWFPYANAST